MEPDNRVWLKHKETGGFFHAPEAVVKDYADQGWEATDDRPVEPNPALAERPAEWFEPIPGPKQTKSRSKKTDADDNLEEGSDSVG